MPIFPRRPAVRSLLRLPLLGCLTALLIVLAGEHTASVLAGITTVVDSERRLFVLSIGINQYPAKSNIGSLHFAVPDAVSVAGVFSTPEVRRTFKDVEVVTLLDSTATVAGIRSALEHLIQVCKPEDVVVLYYAGQAATIGPHSDISHSGSPGSEYNFVVYDSEVTGKDQDMVTNTLGAREISALLLSIQAQRQIVIIDSSYSAAAFDAIKAALNADSVFTLKDTGRKYALFGTAGDASEFPEVGHGLMTYSLLQAMQGGAATNGKGFISEADLEGYMMANIGYYKADPAKPARSLADEQLLSYSDLRGLCLSMSKPNNLDCNLFYGYDPKAGNQATRGFVQKPTAPADEAITRGTDYAVILAGDIYDHWKTLANPIYDAQTLEQELIQNYGYKKENIFYRENPSKRDIHELLGSLQHRAFGKNDRLLVYVAGHGHMEESGEGFLVTRETLLPPEDPYLDSGLDLSRFRSAVDQLPVPHILIVLDVCYGGSFKERKSVPAYTSENLDTTQSVDVLVANKMQHVSRLYIASGGLRSAFDGEPGRHSPFARAFLKTLRQYGGPEHIVDIGSIDGKVQGLCPHPYFGPFGTHEDGGDFIFIPNPNAHPVPDPGLDAKVDGPQCSS